MMKHLKKKTEVGILVKANFDAFYEYEHWERTVHYALAVLHGTCFGTRYVATFQA